MPCVFETEVHFILFFIFPGPDQNRGFAFQIKHHLSVLCPVNVSQTHLVFFFFVKHNRISPNRNYNNSTFYSRCTWKCRVSVGSNELTLPHENSECATEWAIFIQHLLIQHVRRNLSSIKITPILLNIIWPGRSETRSPNLVTPFATRKSFPILYLGRIFRRTMDHLELFDGLTGRNKTESREIKCFLFCTRTCEILILCSNGASKNRACSISINHVRSDPFHRRFL